MIIDIDERASDSPLVEGIWQSRSIGDTGSFISIAENHREIVFTKQYGKTTLSIRGPETIASSAPVPEDAEFLGIVFKHGVFMPDLPVLKLTDSALHIPEGCHNSVYVCGESLEIPTFENADSFINCLVKQDKLVSEPLVPAILQNQVLDVSLRTAQRRFLKATGMTYGTFQQIERAKQALLLLEQGVPILDIVYEAGYADQPHLTRSFKRFLGQTPAEIVRELLYV